jgi:hypothetical protein
LGDLLQDKATMKMAKLDIEGLKQAYEPGWPRNVRPR